MNISDLQSATLKDVAIDHKSVIQQAAVDSYFGDELHELFGEYVGCENIDLLVAYPQAFLDFDSNHLVPWHCLTLDLASNAKRLINAGYPKNDVITRVAQDFYSGNPITGESPKMYQDAFNTKSLDTIHDFIRDCHPELDADLLPDISRRLFDFCLESLEIDRR